MEFEEILGKNPKTDEKNSETIDTTEIIAKSMNLSNNTNKESSSSNSWNTLDCTGIQAESIDNLRSKYDKNQESFYKYLSSYSKRFTEKLKQYDL